MIAPKCVCRNKNGVNGEDRETSVEKNRKRKKEIQRLPVHCVLDREVNRTTDRC